MSYCRWSSDDWQCDVYCYEDVNGGYTTHVAGNRPIGVPENPFSLKDQPTEWLKQHMDQMRFLRSAERQDLNLPYDGQSFSDETLEEFRDTLIMLKEAGYNVPQYVFETIDEEIKEEKEKSA